MWEKEFCNIFDVIKFGKVSESLLCQLRRPNGIAPSSVFIRAWKCLKSELYFDLMLFYKCLHTVSWVDVSHHAKLIPFSFWMIDRPSSELTRNHQKNSTDKQYSLSFVTLTLFRMVWPGRARLMRALSPVKDAGSRTGTPSQKSKCKIILWNWQKQINADKKKRYNI